LEQLSIQHFSSQSDFEHISDGFLTNVNATAARIAINERNPGERKYRIKTPLTMAAFLI